MFRLDRQIIEPHGVRRFSRRWLHARQRGFGLDAGRRERAARRGRRLRARASGQKGHDAAEHEGGDAERTPLV